MSDALQGPDLERVERYLVRNLPGFQGPVEATKFATGQSNPTFLLKTPGRDYVLRRKPSGVLLKSAHAVDREFRVQRALARTDVPVPKMHLLCEDESVIGSVFYIMDHVEGRNFDDPTLPELGRADRRAVIDEMSRVLTALHRVDVDAVGLADYGPPGHYLERQVARWSRQYRATETGAIAAMDRLMRDLADRMPADDGRRSLVHGDYRIDNMIFQQHGTRCLALLDWELSTIGHPYADLAQVIMQWRMPQGAEGRGMAGADRAALGLPSDEEFIASYCERSGLAEVENFDYFLAFAFFRMASILQGVKKRALDGNASNPERAERLGSHVPAFAEYGLDALRPKAPEGRE